MKNKLYITGAQIINENQKFIGNVLVDHGLIKKIEAGEEINEKFLTESSIQHIDAKEQLLIPGIIDDQVHFRDPGLTHKGDIASESKAAVAGGITSFMEMPNTLPQTISNKALKDKFKLASKNSMANFSFYLGATNDNLEEIINLDPKKVCGVKVFMGSSTGNMLVDNKESLEKIFAQSPILVAVHSEHEETIQRNTENFKKEYGENVPIEKHPLIRSEEACYKTTKLAVKLAKKHNTRLHVLHLSTAKELELFSSGLPEEKQITAEVCVHHLWFNESDYQRKGNFIKWNPAIKTKKDQEALFKALLDNKLDIIATDHAPHTEAEKQNTYFKAPSGGPLVQHSLIAMLEFYHQDRISLETIVEKMCHHPAKLFQIDKRGFIREGYHADLVLINQNEPWTVEKSNILYKCGWSPFEGQEFKSKVIHTIINGELVYQNGVFKETFRGTALNFNR